MTVHDYHLVCPRKWMITHRDEPCSTGFGPRCLISNCRAAREGPTWLPYNDLRWLKVWLHRRLLRRWVDLFISPSRHLADWLERNLGIPAVMTVPNFSPPASHPRSPDPTGPVSVLYAGRLAREKGVGMLIRAMARVLEVEPEATLVIAGDGPQRKELEDLAQQELRPGSFRFTGPLPQEDLARLHGQAGLMVLPTLWMENCPVAILEAMAHGRPVIATRIGGIPELVEDGVTGFLFERGDQEDLEAKLLRLTRDPRLCRRTGEAAAKRHRQLFSSGVHASRLATAYDSVLHRKASP